MARLLVQAPTRPIKSGDQLNGCVVLYNVDPRFIRAVTVRLIGYQVLEPMSRNLFMEVAQSYSAAEIEAKLQAQEPLQFALKVPEKMLPASSRITPKMLVKYVLEAVVEREGALRRRLKSTTIISVLGLCRPPDFVQTYKTLRQHVVFAEDEIDPIFAAMSLDVSYPFGNWLALGNTCDVGLHLRSDGPLPPYFRVERVRVTLIAKTNFLTDVGDRDSFSQDYTLRKWHEGIDVSGKETADLSVATRQMCIPSTVFPSFQTLVMECEHVMCVSVLITYGRHRKLVVSRSQVPIVNDPTLPQYEQFAKTGLEPTNLDAPNYLSGPDSESEMPTHPPSPPPEVRTPMLQRLPSPPEYIR